MSTQTEETMWLDARCELTLAELVQVSGMTESELREMVEYGALVPANREESSWTFRGECVVTVQTAHRLREDFGLDPNALSVALGLLERIRGLEAELRALRAQLPRRIP
jgi:chaperone modulatory protein CbpM